MSRKPKFKPVITRVKLNPEQAVLSCGCYSGGNVQTGGHFQGATIFPTLTVCQSPQTRTAQDFYTNCGNIPTLMLEFTSSAASS